MSLFGAKKQTPPFKELLGRAKENFEKRMAKTASDTTTESVSSGIGAQMIKARELQEQDPDGKATTSEIAREELGDYLGGPVVLPREVYNKTARMHNDEAREKGHPSQIVLTVHSGSSVDEEGNLVYKQPRVYTIPSDDGSALSSPPLTTNYGRSEISFPSQTPRERVLSPLPVTNYEGSLLGLPPSAIPQDPFLTPRASAGIITRRYI